jgi:hypothetical protein
MAVISVATSGFSLHFPQQSSASLCSTRKPVTVWRHGLSKHKDLNSNPSIAKKRKKEKISQEGKLRLRREPVVRGPSSKVLLFNHFLFVWP